MLTNPQIKNFPHLMASGYPRIITTALLMCCLTATMPQASGKQQQQQRRAPKSAAAQATPRLIQESVMLRILRAEDERRWDADLSALLMDKSAPVRRRAALAAGRIGDERATGSLVALLRDDPDVSVKGMAAFALGEIESAAGADALIGALRASTSGEVRARAIEALGKVAAALPKSEEARSHTLGEVILVALANESRRAAQPDRVILLAGLTAVLRARPANAGARIAPFLSSGDARLRADAANTLARLRAKDAVEQLRGLLQQDADAVVRANAARALGAAEDHAAFDVLVHKSVNDADERVRVSAVRALGALKDTRAATVLIARADALLMLYRTGRASGISHPQQTNELLEIAATLGRVLDKTNNTRALMLLRALRAAENFRAPEIEIAFAQIAPTAYIREPPFSELTDEQSRSKILKDWRAVSSLSQGLAELARLTNADAGNSIVGLHVEAQTILRSWLDDANTSATGVPDVLRALANFKPTDLGEELRRHLSDQDVMVRATVAELLGDATAAATTTTAAPNETNTRSLAAALPRALRDEMNDAALAILDALGKQKTSFANDAIKRALASPDHLLRRRAVALLKTNNAGDYSARIGTVATPNTVADYMRALARGGKASRALVATDKGNFTLELLPNDAPLTVDSFVQLARRGFFNNTDFHRVVPNFVVQGGDRARGDGNGGPGYQIRCEINEVAYDRGAVGMALSGKDTGGSQWFVTHSPQPHLDGGYTIFGRVIEGMDVVDRIARGDRIRRITITESKEAHNALPLSRTARARRRKRTAP